MAKTVLITGGTGLIGTALTKRLLAKGYEVAHLGRIRRALPHIKNYIWDIKNKTIEPGALESADYIIHLAGAGVFDKPWTDAYKYEIIDSRVSSANILYDYIEKFNLKPKAFITASGVAVYGADTGENSINETTPSGPGFLAEVVHAWESAADKFQNLGIRTVKLRTGIVLDKNGGALEKIVGPIKLGVGAPLGKGSQYIPWIHVDDLCEMYIWSIENENMKNIFNGVSPFPVSNKEFTTEAARILRKPLILPNVHSFILKLYLGGERAEYILGGNRIVNPKIELEGFKYKFPIIKSALHNLLLE